MLNISTNVGRAPVDGADAQSRWSSNGDGSRSDGSGFDDVFSQLNRSNVSASGAGANTSGPQGGANGQQSGQASTPGGLAELLARAKAGSNGSVVSTPADLARARALGALASADGDAPDAGSASDLGAAGSADAAASAALDAATADLPASFPSNGQTIANGVMSSSALTTLADLVGAEAADVKSLAADNVSTSGAASAARRLKPADTTNAAAAPPMDATDAILAALLVGQAPAQVLAGAGTGTSASQANGKKAADVAAASSDEDVVADLPEKTVDAVEPADGSSLEPISSTLLDAQVALRPAGGDRTLVSVVAQATHFPVVERLSLSQQLATPIAASAKSMPDTPTNLAATAPMRTLDVTLSPGDLGSVTISMRLVGGSLHLGVQAQEAGTADMIERDKTTLANALHASGYSVADLTIVHSSESSGQTQSDSNNASQDQRAASGSDTSGSETSGGGTGTNDQAFSRDRASSQQGRSNGEGGGGAVRADRGVYV